MVTQMAEQLVTEGHIDEWELQNMNLHQTRREIGLSLLSHSGKFAWICIYVYSHIQGRLNTYFIRGALHTCSHATM